MRPPALAVFLIVGGLVSAPGSADGPPSRSRPPAQAAAGSESESPSPDGETTAGPGPTSTGGATPGEDGEGDGATSSEAAPDETSSRRSDGFLPSLDVYFPEGELDFRLNRLVKNAFFEGQIRYNFIDADISAFLRYRYYGYARTYTIGVFDVLEFENIEELDNDFERVRGGLLLLEWPHSYHRRTFLLAETDRITSNKEEFRFSTNQTNTFLRLGYQLGTPNDARSNAIVGETRASIQRLFTPLRRIGPQGAGLTGALTFSTDLLGDFQYVKLELEGLKRFDLGRRTSLIHRVHAGTFFDEKTVERDGDDVEPFERLSIPRTDFFRLDGRDNLRGLDQGLRGTNELHTTFELFLPWFQDAERRALGLDWKTWYWILYGGVGAVGFDTSALTDTGSYIQDLGVGFEAAFELRGYSFFVAGIVAHALGDEGALKTRLSIKSYR